MNRPYHSQAAGELALARIAQQLPIRTQHDRQLAGVDVKTFDQRLRVRIGLGIEPSIGMAVAAKKALQPEHVSVLRAADDHRSARSCLEDGDAAQDERALRSPSSASAISNARSCPGWMTRASTGPCAWASTSAGRPDSCASSPMNAPGP